MSAVINNNSKWPSGVIDSSLSDHYLISYNAYARQTYHTKNTPKQYSYIYQKALIQHIVKLNWDFITDFSNVNEDWEKLVLKLMQSID